MFVASCHKKVVHRAISGDRTLRRQRQQRRGTRTLHWSYGFLFSVPHQTLTNGTGGCNPLSKGSSLKFPDEPRKSGQSPGSGQYSMVSDEEMRDETLEDVIIPYPLFLF
jgi:hypothetical protein